MLELGEQELFRLGVCACARWRRFADGCEGRIVGGQCQFHESSDAVCGIPLPSQIELIELWYQENVQLAFEIGKIQSQHQLYVLTDRPMKIY
jgi:hypothetical protein